MKAIEALAEVWASMDGKLDDFRAGKSAKSIEDEPGGYFSGYMSEADEAIHRLAERGFHIVKGPKIPKEPPSNA